VKVRVGDRYIDRPARELAWEAIGAPFFWLLWRWALRGGWSH